MSRRCRSCVFWVRYRGGDTTIPLRSPNACIARYDMVQQKDGTEKKIVTKRESYINLDLNRTVRTHPTEHYGKRTSPNFSCGTFIGKHKPKLKAERSTIDEEQTDGV